MADAGCSARAGSGRAVGQGFPEPQFDGVFRVAEVRLMGADQQHVRYVLAHLEGAPSAPFTLARASTPWRLAVKLASFTAWALTAGATGSRRS